MGYDLLPADPARYAHDFRSDTVGFLALAEMGRSMGEVADTLSDRTFLWSYALLRGVLCVAAFRHRALHTGGESDRHHPKRTDNGRLSAKLLLFGRLPDGSKYRGIEVSEPRAGLGGLDDT